MWGGAPWYELDGQSPFYQTYTFEKEWNWFRPFNDTESSVDPHESVRGLPHLEQRVQVAIHPAQSSVR